MKNELSKELITTMREMIPEGNNLAGMLMEILCIGKEAVYRRLRGEVAFSFNEVVLISKRLGISLDKIASNSFPDGTLFDLNLPHVENPLQDYHESLIRYLSFFKFIKDDPSAEVCTASNVIPYTFYSSYEQLTKFRLCRWMYQNRQIKTPFQLKDLYIPGQIVETQKQLNKAIRQVPLTCFIWDANVFLSLIKEIKYFSELRLISEADIDLIKNELQRLLKELELMTITGEFNTGNRLLIYLSSINFEASYSYIEKSKFQICLYKVYSTITMDTQNTRICNIQKKWIQFLKRHSTLISQSGEIQRINFFHQQREIIDSLI